MDKPLTPVESSNLAQVGYDTASSTLYVEFKHGGLYRYFNVSLDQYTALLAAESCGKYLNAEIKPRHGFEKVDTNSASYDLETHQQQLDMDGVMVGVSRQALTEVLAELQFLRYFYGAAGDAFGPADGDVHDGIVEMYTQAYGKAPPKPYDRVFED